MYTDTVAAGGYYGKGTFYWGGAAGTWFWIDPTDDLIVIGMIQQIAGTGAAAANTIPDVRGLSHAYRLSGDRELAPAITQDGF